MATYQILISKAPEEIKRKELKDFLQSSKSPDEVWDLLQRFLAPDNLTRKMAWDLWESKTKSKYFQDILRRFLNG